MPKKDEDKVDEEVAEEEAEDTNAQEEAAGTEEEASTDAGRKAEQPNNRIPIQRLNNVIKERDAARQELANLKKTQQEAERKRLKEQNDYKTLYEQQTTELERLQADSNTIEAYKTVLQSVLDSTLQELTEEGRSLVPEDLPIDKQLAWIAKNRGMLAKQKAFSIAGGKTGTGKGKPVVKLTPEQMEVARQWNMTPEEYAKFNDIPAEESAETQ